MNPQDLTMYHDTDKQQRWKHVRWQRVLAVRRWELGLEKRVVMKAYHVGVTEVLLSSPYAWFTLDGMT